VNYDTPGEVVPGDTHAMKYTIAQHKDGYQVIAHGADRGISTHTDILAALAACRAANRYVRALGRKCVGCVVIQGYGYWEDGNGCAVLL
jgi:hypothetical protein